MGFDVFYENNLADLEIITTANREDRIILTRDRGLLKHSIVSRGYWLRETNPVKQAREIIRRFNLTPHINPFSRCISCNGIIKQIDKQDVVEDLPANTKKYYDLFYQCQHCKKIYWEGPHFEKMRALIARLIQ